MDLGTALDRAATAHAVAELRAEYPPASPPPGVSTRTWRRLRNQAQWNPSRRIGDALRAAYDSIRRREGPPDGGFTFVGDVEVSDDRRPKREIRARNWLGPENRAVTGAILDALNRRDLAGAAYTMTTALSVAIGQTVTVHDVESASLKG